jgi:hypothetical protein
MKKLQIIETSDYVLAVSGNVDELYNTSIQELINKGWVIAYQPKGNAPELDLPLLPEMVIEDDVRKLALTLYKEPLNKEGETRTQLVGHGSTPFGFNKWFKSFKIGYKAATKRFSEEDLKQICRELSAECLSIDGEVQSPAQAFLWINKRVESLKQPKKPKWFVAEHTSMNKGYTDKNDYPYQECEVLRTTTINGKTYLIGHYEF